MVPVAKATKAIIRASPPLKTISKASASLNKAAISNRHYVKALMSLVATRNLIKSIIFFRPVNRKTLKPGSPLWKVFLKAVWMAIWPALGQGLAKRFVKKPVTEAVEVEACEEKVSGKEEHVVSSKEEEVIVKVVKPKVVAGALATYAAELRAIEARAAATARIMEEQEAAFQKEFDQIQELDMTDTFIQEVGTTFEANPPVRPVRPVADLGQMKEAKDLLRQIEAVQAANSI